MQFLPMIAAGGLSAAAGGKGSPPPPTPQPLYHLQTVPDAEYQQTLNQTFDPIAQQNLQQDQAFQNNATSQFTPAALKSGASGDLTNLTEQQVGKYANVANMIPTAISAATKQGIMNRKDLADAAMQRNLSLQNELMNRDNTVQQWYYKRTRPNPFLSFLQGAAANMPGLSGSAVSSAVSGTPGETSTADVTA